MDELRQVGRTEVWRCCKIFLQVARSVHHAMSVQAVADAIHVRNLVHRRLARAVQRHAVRHARAAAATAAAALVEIAMKAEDARARLQAREPPREHVVIANEQVGDRHAQHAEAIGGQRAAGMGPGGTAAAQRLRLDGIQQVGRVQLPLRLAHAVRGADIAPVHVLSQAARLSSARIDAQHERRQQLDALAVVEGAARRRAPLCRAAAGLGGRQCRAVALDGKDVDGIAPRLGHGAWPTEALGHRLRRLAILCEPVVNVRRQRQRREQVAMVRGERREEPLLAGCAASAGHDVRGWCDVAQQRIEQHRVRPRDEQQLVLLLVHCRDNELDRPRMSGEVGPVGLVRERERRLTVGLDRRRVAVVRAREQLDLRRKILVLVGAKQGRLEVVQPGSSGRDTYNARAQIVVDIAVGRGRLSDAPGRHGVRASTLRTQFVRTQQAQPDAAGRKQRRRPVLGSAPSCAARGEAMTQS
eukprot:6418135-Prymnesium_polylepis.2